jgi:hypothetical protein
VRAAAANPREEGVRRLDEAGSLATEEFEGLNGNQNLTPVAERIGPTI